MRRKAAYTLVELMVVMVLIAILAVAGFLAVKQAISNSRVQVCNQQAQETQNALNAWVARQPSLNAAIAQFQPAPDGITYEPKDLTTLLAAINVTLASDNDALRTDDNKTIISTSLSGSSAYLTITWPIMGGSLRSTYPRVNLVLPAE